MSSRLSVHLDYHQDLARVHHRFALGDDLLDGARGTGENRVERLYDLHQADGVLSGDGLARPDVIRRVRARAAVVRSYRLRSFWGWRQRLALITSSASPCGVDSAMLAIRFRMVSVLPVPGGLSKIETEQVSAFSTAARWLRLQRNG